MILFLKIEIRLPAGDPSGGMVSLPATRVAACPLPAGVAGDPTGGMPPCSLPPTLVPACRLACSRRRRAPSRRRRFQLAANREWNVQIPPIWWNECVPHLARIFPFLEPLRSIPFSNRKRERVRGVERFHYIPVGDTNRTLPHRALSHLFHDADTYGSHPCLASCAACSNFCMS
jgi:hypothetical protein